MAQELNLKDWRFSIDKEDIAWAVFDREGQSVNTLGRRPIEELGQIIDHVEPLARDRSIRGLVIISGKQKGFIAGADISEFDDFTEESQVIEMLKPVLELLDRIEHLKAPVVAAIHGFCLGGGLELALACHYRIATRDDSTKLGFPEVKLGIFPGFNGTARSIQQAGPVAAMQAMLTGKMYRASAARGMGLVDQLVDSAGALHWAARKAVLKRRKAKPAGRAKQLMTKWPARALLAKKMRDETAKKAREDHYPAPFRLIDLFEAHGGNYEAMKAAEPKAFAPLMVSDTSRNLRRVFRLTELLKGQAPRGLKWRPKRAHIIGAGTMGADIAGVCVAAGMEVTLQDINAEQLQKGIKSQSKLFKRRFKTKPAQEAAKVRLIADPDGEGVSRADVIIEAIVERLDVKQNLFATLEDQIKPDAVLATNTSSLKLEDIAQPLKDPGRLIGLHFFSPVPQMPLVEVVKGASTRQDEVDKGAAFVTAIGKFPLITKDVPGFLVNKVLTPYMFAAMERLENGEDKEKIDAAARDFGMPMGPIELADNVGLDICAHVADILGYSSDGSKLDRLVKSGRLGKKTGEGYYVWKDGKPQTTKAEFSKTELADLGRQLVEPMIAEAQKSLDEGVVEAADLVDAGMIFGTGFAPFRGGPLHYKAQSGDDGGGSDAMAAAE
jgi:3-hydroxyacyl-CoA dehydrogenase / enoyl-CoA hydratase / 3-hydroxybutyryl-CoA epimerase